MASLRDSLITPNVPMVGTPAPPPTPTSDVAPNPGLIGESTALRGYEGRTQQEHRMGHNPVVDRAMRAHWHSQDTKEATDKFVMQEAKDLGIPVHELVKQLGPGFVEHYMNLPGNGKLLSAHGSPYEGMSESYQEPPMGGEEMRAWMRQ